MPGKEKKQHLLLPVLLFIMIGMPGWVWAEIVGYELTVAREMVSIAGATAQGMTINGGIPGPTLRLKEAARVFWERLVSVNLETILHVNFNACRPWTSPMWPMITF